MEQLPDNRSTPNGGTVRDSNDTLDALRAAVEQHSRAGAAIDDLQVPLQEFCECARREHLHPEQVLVRLKHALDGMSVSDTDPTLKDVIRSRIVSLAIRTYFNAPE